MATSASHRGWKYEPSGYLAAVYDGAEIFSIADTGFAVGSASQFVGEVDFEAEVDFNANLILSSTLTAGTDGVGADGEQLTSGGAAAECDWAAAGSLRAFKNLLRKRDDAEDALKMIAETPVYDFKYKRKGETDERITSTGDVETVYTGIMADEAPWAMHHNGRILNPINTFGYTMLAIKALLARVEDLEGQLKVARA